MTTYHLDLGDNRTEALDSVTQLTLAGTELDIDAFAAGDAKAPVPLWGDVVLARGGSRHQATTAWVEDVENTDTHQDVILIAGDPADPTSRRIRLVDAWASSSYHLDEDDDPDAFMITFADIAVEK
ncbi:hypothetical protein ELQ87_26920 [Streptomyces griseoviridis]|uniref:Phage tail protein n=2 Tax=Streptomyces TaxID=1883 RepID=A0A3S9ZIB7_STRGD|nr:MULTISPECIES: hypothetical protein [Streptomyces]AZS87458.1 hypothetical protein ELQ87_26920 [Streptomyces griseoviridis]MDT0471137.1 hypothetical protein [Streptomyces sp. DSM 41014]QCN85695.1 hypothetical protein DDJ31_12355 [Streptomyces griseoviridis]